MESKSNFSEEGKVGNPLYDQPRGGQPAPSTARRTRDAPPAVQEEKDDRKRQREWQWEYRQEKKGSDDTGSENGSDGSGSGSGGGHPKPPRIAVRAPPTYSRSFSEPELSPVAEADFMGRGESDVTSSGCSTGGGRSGIAAGSDGERRR